MKIPEHKNCINCGSCCGPIMATKKEIDKIKQFVSKMPEPYKEQLKKQKRTFLTCQFRDIENKKCAIYPIRPTICRIFGVVKGMECDNGNSKELDGKVFIPKEKAFIVPKLL